MYKKLMVIFISMFLIGILGLVLTNVCEKTQTYIDLPEEIQAASKGDTMVLYEYNNTVHLLFYHGKYDIPMPSNAKLVIVK